MEEQYGVPIREISSRKQDFLKGSPKFPNGISKQKMRVPFALCYYFQTFQLVPVEMFVEMEHAYPMDSGI